MRLGKRTILQASVLGLLSGLTLVTSAQAQWRDERHGPAWRDDHARFEHRASVRHEDWRFDRGRGWRFEHRPGFWSPYYVWWWTGGRVVMLAAPTVTVVNYPTGQYQLRGDGITVPYYWGVGAGAGVYRGASAARGTGRSGHAAGRLAASAAPGGVIAQIEPLEEA